MSSVTEEKGSLSINSENIFPIIKKWLYSDHDIFFRELISNGCDAITKMKKLEVMGEVTLPEDNEWKVTVKVSPEEKTISIIDNGIGMTAEEVKQYINQIAFSGAQAFVEKYKDKTNEDCIIGHFGLGFYSAFMVAHKVTIETKSYKEGEPAVHWESEEGVDFEMSEGSRTERGTEITLYLNEDSYEFSNEYRAKEVIEKYCSFMPTPIYFENVDVPKKEEAKSAESEEKDAEEKDTEEKKPQPINDPNPLWTKHPNDCTEEEYKKFYRDVFHDYKEPLFWIHLNMDYPFNLKGILYFPKINTEYENLDGVIKLYSNQVFIADNIKEVIPEFLLLLKGVIDCPDLPLNVSRSALQNDGFVKKISDYITKKVADKLSGMCKVERENYEKYWDDISPFIKYGCLKDEKFCEKMKDYMLFKNLEGKYITLKDYVEAAKKTAGEDTAEETPIVENADGTSATGEDSENTEESAEEKKQVVYYVTDERQQSQYINMFKEAGLDAIFLTHNIDQPYISKLEYDNKEIRFQRIDADLTEAFKDEVTENEEDWKKLTETVTELVKKALNKEKLTVKVEKLKNEKVASMITLSEDSRRMQDMMKMYNMYGMDPSAFGGEGETLVLNANHPLVKYVFEHKKSKNASVICEQLYDLAMLSHKPLAPEEMTKFIERSNEIMLLLTK